MIVNIKNSSMHCDIVNCDRQWVFSLDTVTVLILATKRKVIKCRIPLRQLFVTIKQTMYFVYTQAMIKKKQINNKKYKVIQSICLKDVSLDE